MADLRDQGARGPGRVPKLKWLMWECIAQSGTFDPELELTFDDGPSASEPELEPTWIRPDTSESGEW